MKATFGAGCFWGVEHAFRKVNGVVNTRVGYEGGDTDNPTYKEVCAGGTGHAEVCEVEYDPEQVSYEVLLEVFWNIHDPTQVNRQGPDVGAQYRSVIFTHSEGQQEIAEQAKKAQIDAGKAVVTQIVPAMPFWRAEEYHQCYFGR